MFKDLFSIICFAFLCSCAIGEPLEYEYSINLSNIVAAETAEIACESSGGSLAKIKDVWNGNELQNFINENCPYDLEIEAYPECWVMTNNGIRLVSSEWSGGLELFQEPNNFSMATPICERVIND